MTSRDPTGTNWTDIEIDLIIADYLEMLNFELSGQHYVKSHRNESLRQLINRSHGSIEFKHQNISAVLRSLGYPWITGYKPMANFQRGLLSGIERMLESNMNAILPTSQTREAELNEETTLFFEPPPNPTSQNTGKPDEITRLIRKFDPAKRDSRNRKLGHQGEEIVFHAERNRLNSLGRADLARKIIWVSEVQGDGAGYDILSFEANGEERLLEVKSTAGHQTTPFYISENERSLSEEQPDKFRLVRLYDLARIPRAFQIAPPLESALILQPTNYRASF